MTVREAPKGSVVNQVGGFLTFLRSSDAPGQGQSLQLLELGKGELPVALR